MVSNPGAPAKDLLLALSTSLLMAFSLPPYDLDFFAWFGLVPLLIAISEKGAIISFGFSWIAGLLFFPIVFSWIIKIQIGTLFHHIMLDFYLSLYFAIFGFGFSVVRSKLGLLSAFAATPFLWITVEYLRSNLFFLALPWALLAHSQHCNPRIIQIASITGAYGISFLMVLVNVAFCILILYLRAVFQKDKAVTQPISWRLVIIFVGIAGGAAVFSDMYGNKALRQPFGGEAVRLAVIQGNIEQTRKWDKKYAASIIETYTRLSMESAKENPSIIIWPETATPGSVSMNYSVGLAVRNVVFATGTHLLVGSSQMQKFAGKEPESRITHYNSAFFIPYGEGKPQRYDKIKLLPFSEYLPYRNTIPWRWIGIPESEEYLPGTSFKVMKLHEIGFSTTICWENIFPDIFREFVKNGAQFVVNITNEAWFEQTAAPYQFLAMSVFRAVENGVWVVRCANTGISCFIDPRGRVVDRVKDQRGRDIFVEGFLAHTITASIDKGTFYTHAGDWLVWLSLMVTGLFLLAAHLKKTYHFSLKKKK